MRLWLLLLTAVLVQVDFLACDQAVFDLTNELEIARRENYKYRQQYAEWSDQAAALAEADEPIVGKASQESVATPPTPKKQRTVLPGPKCYQCTNNCSEDYTSDVIKTCTADQICVRKTLQFVSDTGKLTIRRSSGCTYVCKVGYIISSSLNMTTKCCESYKDKDCNIPEYTADAYKPKLSLPKTTIAILVVFNLMAGYFF